MATIERPSLLFVSNSQGKKVGPLRMSLLEPNCRELGDMVMAREGSLGFRWFRDLGGLGFRVGEGQGVGSFLLQGCCVCGCSSGCALVIARERLCSKVLTMGL